MKHRFAFEESSNTKNIYLKLKLKIYVLGCDSTNKDQNLTFYKEAVEPKLSITETFE